MSAIRELYFEKGKIAIFKDLVVKEKIINSQLVTSYFIFIADEYFYLNAAHMTQEKFIETYQEPFRRLFNSSGKAKEFEYKNCPIVFNMTNARGHKLDPVIVFTPETYTEFTELIRNGYRDISAVPVNRAFFI